MKYSFFFVSVSVRLVLTPDFCSNPGVDFSIDRKSSLSQSRPGRNIIPVSGISCPGREYLSRQPISAPAGISFPASGVMRSKASVGCFGTEEHAFRHEACELGGLEVGDDHDLLPTISSGV